MSNENRPGSFWKRVTINGEGDPRFPDDFKSLPEFPGNISAGDLSSVTSEFEYSMPFADGTLSIRMGVRLPCSVSEIHYAAKAAVGFNKMQLEQAILNISESPVPESSPEPQVLTEDSSTAPAPASTQDPFDEGGFVDPF
jgi:hypothetical protein